MNYRPGKEAPYRVWFCVGGDRIHRPWESGTPKVDMLTFKLPPNSIVSTPNEKLMSINIKYLYLNTPIPQYVPPQAEYGSAIRCDAADSGTL